ncbi:hypothetical protein ACH58_23335 [Achromobacter xylosoxidans]|uniref:ketoacyl-ACP synthase III n=1 Tax=Alcaligenes xylosoxydans xylosoxydans TaxID=85698 RepID=UPI00064DE318|nr:ketoacyl-ACP synthase III [Achromobacter xylosoxidans]KMJ88301.1 hypothetical protein ACH58_23335 [Achromobacter xylosoxidans]
MIGIRDIASYIPVGRIDNTETAATFGVDRAFLEGKLGVLRRSVAGADEQSSDMALQALHLLCDQSGLDPAQIGVLVVVTQNPDVNLPHVSAVVHGKAGLPDTCAAFDISLGCSGYVYGLSIIHAFMKANDISHGVLITADPYSKIVDDQDKATSLLFGDAATATLLGPEPVFTLGPVTFGTRGAAHEALIARDGLLHMDGREVFNFAATGIPADLAKVLTMAQLRLEDIDCFILHQGSRYIVDTITKRAGLPADKVRFGMQDYGNTVSSSIPLLLRDELGNQDIRQILLSGFGVGLSWASCVLKRNGAIRG